MSVTRDDYVRVLEEFYGDWPGMERALSACADSLVALHGEEIADVDGKLHRAAEHAVALLNDIAELTEKCVALQLEVDRSHREMGRLVAENARLREEQQETRDHFDRMDTIVRQERNSALNRVAELKTENARLRAELRQERELLWRESEAVAGLHATIERVRVLVDLRERLDDPVSRYLAAELRAALDGGSDDV